MKYSTILALALSLLTVTNANAQSSNGVYVIDYKYCAMTSKGGTVTIPKVTPIFNPKEFARQSNNELILNTALVTTGDLNACHSCNASVTTQIIRDYLLGYKHGKWNKTSNCRELTRMLQIINRGK